MFMVFLGSFAVFMILGWFLWFSKFISRFFRGNWLVFMVFKLVLVFFMVGGWFSWFFKVVSRFSLFLVGFMDFQGISRFGSAVFGCLLVLNLNDQILVNDYISGQNCLRKILFAQQYPIQAEH